MHTTYLETGVLFSTAIVGGNIPIATGVGLAIKLRNEQKVVVCFFGDGASNNGTFGESLNMSAIWKLPLIWVVENNLYAMGTPIKMMCPSANIAQRADGYCIPNIVVDGNNALEVYEATVEAVKRARAGEGPTLIECQTYRMRGHSRFDPAKYRPEDEAKHWLSEERDAVRIIKEIAIEQGALTEKDVEKIETKISKDVEKAAQFAKKSEYPKPEDALNDVFAEVL